MLSAEYNDSLIQGEVVNAFLGKRSLVPRGGRKWCSAFPKRVHEKIRTTHRITRMLY